MTKPGFQLHEILTELKYGSPIISVACLVICGFGIVIFLLPWYNFSTFAKGPWGLPLVGYLPFLGCNPAKTFYKLQEIYGPIFTVKLGSMQTIILDSNFRRNPGFLIELSGRPYFTNFRDMSKGKGIAFVTGPGQIEQRKFSQRLLKNLGMGTHKFESVLRAEILTFLEKLRTTLKNEDVCKKHTIIHHFFGVPVINTIWNGLLGESLQDSENTAQIFELLEKMMDTSSTLKAQLSWFFPSLANVLSYVGSNCTVNCFRSMENYVAEQIMQKRKTRLNTDVNFTCAYIDQVHLTANPHSSFHQSREEQAITTMDILGGAIDTTTSFLDWLILHMACEPNVQRKLQAEIDLVVGHAGSSSQNLTPTFSHKDHMPYANAVIMELFRISPVVPLLPRRALNDLCIDSYRISKDITVLPNLYGSCYDPRLWYQPNKFCPERFLNSVGAIQVIGDVSPFGFGMRSCIGEAVARDMLFLFSVSFFQQFTVASTLPKPSLNGLFGIVTLAKPFEVILTAR